MFPGCFAETIDTHKTPLCVFCAAKFHRSVFFDRAMIVNAKARAESKRKNLVNVLRQDISDMYRDWWLKELFGAPKGGLQ